MKMVVLPFYLLALLNIGWGGKSTPKEIETIFKDSCDDVVNTELIIATEETVKEECNKKWLLFAKAFNGKDPADVEPS